MAETDWTYLNDGLDVSAVARGATAGVARPPGGGQFLFGFNSLAAVQGAAGLFVSINNFAPLTKGGSIRGCIQRGPSGGPTSFTPLFFMSAQGPSVNDLAYLLGLSDDDPHHIVLRKGPIVNGAGSATDPGVLLRSADSFAQGTWLHVRLDVVVNPNGDVVLAVFQNDLTAQPIGTAPNWVAVNGMASFIDDQLQVNTGSAPLTSGRAGFALAVKDTTRRGFFDAVEVYKQTALMDAFTARLGSSEGRVTQEGGTLVFVLGDLQIGRFHDLVPGDYAEIAQTADLSGVPLVRVRGTLRAPAMGAWRVSLRVGGAEVAGLAGWPGVTRTITDLAANVSALSAPTEIAVRLTLVAAS